MKPLEVRVHYNKERDPQFAQQIKKMPGCENLEHCIQCGTCSATCPLSVYMDLTPRKVIYLTRAGFKDQVLKCWSIWVCASCYGCTVECPKKIKVTDVMYALKRQAIKDKVYRKKIPIPVLAQAFFKMVRTHGRTSEGRLVMGLFLKTNIKALFSMARLGVNLLLTRRMTIKQESIEKRQELKAMLDEV